LIEKDDGREGRRRKEVEELRVPDVESEKKTLEKGLTQRTAETQRPQRRAARRKKRSKRGPLGFRQKKSREVEPVKAFHSLKRFGGCVTSNTYASCALVCVKLGREPHTVVRVIREKFRRCGVSDGDL